MYYLKKLRCPGVFSGQVEILDYSEDKQDLINRINGLAKGFADSFNIKSHTDGLLFVENLHPVDAEQIIYFIVESKVKLTIE